MKYDVLRSDFFVITHTLHSCFSPVSVLLLLIVPQILFYSVYCLLFKICLCVTNLAQEVFAVDCGCRVTFQLGPGGWRKRLQLLRVHRVAQLMVGPLDPVPTELRQQDEREGAFSAQHL